MGVGTQGPTAPLRHKLIVTDDTGIRVYRHSSCWISYVHNHSNILMVEEPLDVTQKCIQIEGSLILKYSKILTKDSEKQVPFILIEMTQVPKNFQSEARRRNSGPCPK